MIDNVTFCRSVIDCGYQKLMLKRLCTQRLTRRILSTSFLINPQHPQINLMLDLESDDGSLKCQRESHTQTINTHILQARDGGPLKEIDEIEATQELQMTPEYVWTSSFP